jgi:MFS family permease
LRPPSSQNLLVLTSRTPIWMLAVSVFSANLGLSVIFPLIPHLAQSGAHAVGWIFSSYAACLVVAHLIGGALADRFETRRVLAFALWGYVLTLLGFCVARSVPALMIVRSLEGFAIGLVIPCVMKLVVAGAPAERRGRAIGLVMGVGGLGFILGPVLGASLSAITLNLPFLVAAGVAGVAALGMSLGLATTTRLEPAETLKQAVATEIGHLKRLLAMPAFLALVLPLLTFKVNFSTLQAGVPIYAGSPLGVGTMEVGWLFVITAVIYAMVQPLAGRLSDRFGAHALVMIALSGLAALLFGLGLAREFSTFLPVWVAFSIVQCAGSLFAIKHLGDGVGERSSGRTFGLAGAVADSGMILAPSLILPLYAWRAEGLFWGLAAVTVGLMALTRALGRRPGHTLDHERG